MSVASKVSSKPIGEVRRRSHKYVPNQARSGLALPRERCGAPFVAFTGLRELPDAPNRRILAMQPSPSGESRFNAPSLPGRGRRVTSPAAGHMSGDRRPKPAVSPGGSLSPNRHPPITHRTAHDPVEKAARGATGLPFPVHPHMLRHACGIRARQRSTRYPRHPGMVSGVNRPIWGISAHSSRKLPVAVHILDRRSLVATMLIRAGLVSNGRAAAPVSRALNSPLTKSAFSRAAPARR